MNTPLYDRRAALKIGATGLMSLATPFSPLASAAEKEFDIAKAHRSGLNRFPRMVQEHLVARVREIEEKAVARRMGLKTKEDAEAYIKEIQGKIQQSFGPWPERTPLNAKVISTLERDSYNVENILFESRPGFLVTANLYIPTDRKGPLPGVVGTCGHTRNGKAGYQEFAQGLVRQGYVVFIYDPIDQGERFQYVDENLKPFIGPGTSGHNHMGNQQLLVGDNIASWRARDGMRALDYLMTRDEVDKNHLGITGNSGGGTMTTWLAGVESRWTMIAPSCFVSSFRRNLENEEAQDAEQCPPLALALGLDHVDFLLASAPDPLIILSKEKDFFDVRGAEEAYAQMQHVYKLLGVPNQVGMFTGPTTHGYSQENREAMYGWFNAITKVSQTSTEPEIKKEEDATLYCAPDGQVARLKSKTVFDFTSDKAAKLANTRKPITDLSTLQNTIKDVLRIPATLPDSPPEYRVMKRIRGNDYPKKYNSRYAVETEPGIHALVYRLSDTDHPSRPTVTDAPAILYVAHISSDYELGHEPLIKEAMEAQPKAVVYTCDVRGIGESRPDVARNDSFLNVYGGDYMHAAFGLMLDEPYAGRKTLDVLRTLQFLAAYGHKEVHLVGRGWGAIPATFAGVLSPMVTQVTLKAAPESFTDIAQTERYKWPLNALPYRILEHMDLTDCYRALESKGLKRI